MHRGWSCTVFDASLAHLAGNSQGSIVRLGTRCRDGRRRDGGSAQRGALRQRPKVRLQVICSLCFIDLGGHVRQNQEGAAAMGLRNEQRPPETACTWTMDACPLALLS